MHPVETSNPSVTTPPEIQVAVGVITRADGRVLMARRPAGKAMAGYWEFPGGKIDPGEDPVEAARRELLEETGLDGGEFEPLAIVVHDYAEAPLRFHVFLTRDPVGEVTMDTDREHAWLPLKTLLELPMPEANRQMLRALRWRVEGAS